MPSNPVKRWLWLLPALLCWVGLVPLAAAQPPKVNVVHPLPPQTPPWIDGYQVRWPVRVVGLASQHPGKTVMVALPTGGWLRPDAGDLLVQAATGKVLPHAVLSHQVKGETVIQFPRQDNDNWYWVYGVNPPVANKPVEAQKTPLFHEGISVEARDWQGDSLDSWPAVRAGMEKSATVSANGIVLDVFQNCNPGRPDVPQQFTVAYRGYFQVAKEGAHRFFLNGDGACFLFIDGFKVFERPGATNRPLGTLKVSELDKLAGKVDLKPGVHTFEAYQAVGELPQSSGVLALAWSPVGEPKFTLMPPAAFVRPLYARAAAAELRTGTTGMFFVQGIDDSFDVAGLKLFLVRYEAHGNVAEDKLLWDMGDGTQRKGRSVAHCYFKEGDYEVKLQGGSLPPFARRVRIWAEPGELSPLTLDAMVEALQLMEWRKLDLGRIREVFTFLQTCEAPNRWPFLEQVAAYLLEQKSLDLETRVQLHIARLDALTQLGKATEALRLAEQVKTEFVKTPALAVRLQLATAAIHQYHYKDFAAASNIYKAIIDENSRIEHPNLRLAAVRWGDLFAESGDLVRASETYRLASTLGGDKFAATSGDASTRGALLRIAEQKLKSGEVVQTRQLLQRLELEFPGRRLDGLFCFLRAESDRLSGRCEEALRSYEMIFRLPQWAGYKDRATHGIADSYFRLGDLPKAQQWYATLKEAFPKYLDEKKAAEIEQLIAGRLARVKALGTESLVTEVRIALEPEEEAWWGDHTQVAVVRAQGIQGPHSILTEVPPTPGFIGYMDWQRPVGALVPGGLYIAEIWYRDVVRVPPPAAYQTPMATMALIKLAAPDGADINVELPRNSHHQWHKVTVKLRAPLDQEFRMRVRLNNITGPWLFDRFSLRYVSDRRMDSLVNFLESSKEP